MKKWKLNLIHFSHTDIGYTDTQTRILTNQVNYLKDMIKDYENDSSKFVDWVWTAESFYIVELFLNQASAKEKTTFLKMVNKKIISITGSYLNMTELANTKLFSSTLSKARKFAEKNNIKFESAITNDINGYSYGYANAMCENGVNNLYFGLHTHHGMFPCFKKQHPFYWKTSTGKKILVWIGEHYQLGNELGVVNTSMGNYILQSSFESGNFTPKNQLLEGLKRLKAYLKAIEKSGYPFENIPITVLGENTDNAPYNLAIRDRIKQLREVWGKELDIEINMVSLDQFFENIKKENKIIPEYRGDWPDWWTDGVGSMPTPVRIFREAQRQYNLICDLKIKSNLLNKLEEELILFAEHTYGYWKSIEDPFSFTSQEILNQKATYASRALMISTKILDEYTKRRVHKLEKKDEIKIIFENPYDSEIISRIPLMNYLSGSELIKLSNEGFEVYKDKIKVKTAYQNHLYMGTPDHRLYAITNIPANKKIELVIKNKHQPKFLMTTPTSMKAADSIIDTYNPLNKDRIIIYNKTYRNDYFEIKWNDREIYSLVSLKNNQQLLSKEQHGLFTPVYELGEIPYEHELMNFQRRWTGRNRKTKNSIRYIGKIKEVRVIQQTIENSVIDFYFEVKGTKYYRLRLEISNDTKTIEAQIKLIKDIEWSLENFYISLPFAKPNSKIKLDKGEMFEIWKEQLPGTLIDYYSIQEGIKVEKKQEDILISMPDSSLVWTGPLTYQNRFLAHDERNPSSPSLYCWAMNTAWETNFSANISGFHEFRFKIYIPGKKISDKQVLNDLKVMNNTFVSHRKVG